MGNTTHAGDLPRTLFPSSWRRGQGMAAGSSSGLRAAQQPNTAGVVLHAATGAARTPPL